MVHTEGCVRVQILAVAVSTHNIFITNTEPQHVNYEREQVWANQPVDSQHALSEAPDLLWREPHGRVHMHLLLDRSVGRGDVGIPHNGHLKPDIQNHNRIRSFQSRTTAKVDDHDSVAHTVHTDMQPLDVRD